MNREDRNEYRGTEADKNGQAECCPPAAVDSSEASIAQRDLGIGLVIQFELGAINGRGGLKALAAEGGQVKTDEGEGDPFVRLSSGIRFNTGNGAEWNIAIGIWWTVGKQRGRRDHHQSAQ